MPDNTQSLKSIIAERCADAPISYRDYIDIALYTKKLGYYEAKRERVGRSSDRDFYTAESLGPVFAQLVVTAIEDLLPDDIRRQATFIEIAAEPERALLDSLDSSPFSTSRVIRLGDQLSARGPVVIFANEWLDALPFHRLIYLNGKWHERGVIIKDNALSETLLPELSAPVEAVKDRLPKSIEEGYQLDLPLEAESALKHLIEQDWTGLLLLFDYGKTWDALINDTPNGTARTFYRHQQGQDLIESPGERDITCDVCWSSLENILKASGLRDCTLESQEAFLVKRAARGAEAIIAESAGHFSHRRQTLMELIHPANMGQRFQVLWGKKGLS